MTDNIDLSSLEDADMEVLPEGNALGSFSTMSSVSSSGSTYGCASTAGSLG
ncbi:thiocillin family RiPP [Actinomyces ruminicola]|uniref:thiocillin family RiPP n=1 Tax=Actinomyces ruminicola TaxID=332524 RepID=UPI0011CBB51C|nr:thiocillin family RiPP [Actinomyces ruminicola]